MVDGFVQQYKDGGWTSRWSSPGYADLMTGTSLGRGVRGRVRQGRRLRREGGVRRGAEERDGRAADVGRGPQGHGDLALPRLHEHRHRARACRGRWRATSTTTASREMGQALYKKTGKKRYKEESEYFLNRAQDYVQALRLEGRLLPGQGRRRATGGCDSAEYDPRVWGYDYTETERLGLRLHRPAGQPGPGQPVRRPRRARRRSSTRTSPPRRRPRPEFVGSYGGVIHEMTEARDVRMGKYGHSNQVAHHVDLHVRRGRRSPGRPRRTSARCSPGSTPAARSARATTATRTTASSRPGTCSPRSASTRW